MWFTKFFTSYIIYIGEEDINKFEINKFYSFSKVKNLFKKYYEEIKKTQNMVKKYYQNLLIIFLTLITLKK